MRASFSPDEREIVTAGSDGTARVFVVSRADEPVDNLVQLSQLLSANRLDHVISIQRESIGISATIAIHVNPE